jgi:hypothetical protein
MGAYPLPWQLLHVPLPPQTVQRAISCSVIRERIPE